ncbi:hypothetical protein [Legionella waltersii]|uniref:Leucine-rich repeat-containing protein n=1 Tax=Legionella waltersii TaxID=66969 RepID=A0A0W1A5M0_9GAMM|nr:hypothetical protein [Legionella waltersii]KTD76307.1 leucine-rich repeat-containing protein [Legionella waltersii]SNV13597.1 leucine-rich repeat-containing protein [Legionella waltersii]
MATNEEIQSIKNNLMQRIETCRTQGTHSLHLSFLYLHLLSMDDLLVALQSIPCNVNSLFLCGNDLYKFGAKNIQTILQSIPENVKKIYLGYNQLNILGVEGIKTVQQSLHPSVALDLMTGNDLHQLRDFKQLDVNVLMGPIRGARIRDSQLAAKDLIFELKHIPLDITTLDLSNRNLHEFDLVDLAKALATMPSHVTYVDLSNNGLFINKTPKEIADFKQNLDKKSHRFHLAGNDESNQNSKNQFGFFNHQSKSTIEEVKELQLSESTSVNPKSPDSPSRN